MENVHRDSSVGLFSTAIHWVEFLPAESVAICCIVCPRIREIAEKDRLWKHFCRQRWSHTNAGDGNYRRAYASLNGWRNPRLRRVILSTLHSPASGQPRTRASQANANNGGHAKNISAMDVGPSRVVVCSADYAWYYRVHPGNRDPQQYRRLRHERPPVGTALDTSGGEDGRGGECGEASSPSMQLRGFPLPSSSVAEARLSGDEERCFFGTTSGHIYVHECRDADLSQPHPHLQARWTPTVALVTPAGSPVAVRQVMANLEGGCPKGSRLGVLCRPPSGWQPDLNSVGAGYLFLVDNGAQASTRSIKLGHGYLGGQKFPTSSRGGAAVSAATLSSEGMPFSPSGGDLFAIGFSGGSIAVLDGRCGEGSGMVGGFVAAHRWLERVRCAGPLLMASYGRTKHIETWDIRMLPSRPLSRDGFAPLLQPPYYAPPAPPRLTSLACAHGSPDFWVEPHGLTVAVYGAPRNSQRFGAKHAFWAWPKIGDSAAQGWRPQGQAIGRDTAAAVDRNENAARVPRDSRSGFPHPLRVAETGFAGGRVEMAIPGVVNDSDYRLCLSTGIKFVDTHMATVLDPSRVLVDEVVVAGSDTCRSSEGSCSVGSVMLTA